MRDTLVDFKIKRWTDKGDIGNPGLFLFNANETKKRHSWVSEAAMKPPRIL
jgi:hypothetical protein